MEHPQNPINNNQAPLQININPDELPDIECSKCGGTIFTVNTKKIKRVSGLINPDGQERYLHIDITVCAGCSEPLPVKP